MKKFVIQMQVKAWGPWVVCTSLQFDTLAEAEAAFERLPVKSWHRIAESYTQVRYKPVKRTSS